MEFTSLNDWLTILILILPSSVLIGRFFKGTDFAEILNAKKIADQQTIKQEQYLKVLVQIQRQILLTNPSNPPNYEEIFNILGPVSHASRVYVFENHYDIQGNLLTSQKAQWCQEGIKSEIDNPQLQNLSFSQDLPRWLITLSQGKKIMGVVTDFPESERLILEPLGILSFLILPITVNGEFFGFIGFDNCKNEQLWDELDQELLQEVANGISLAYEHYLAEKELLERSRQSILVATITFSLTQQGNLQDILQECSEAIVNYFNATCVKIWILNNQENCLELQANAGITNRITDAYNTIPVGKFKIGTIPLTCQPEFSNDLLTDDQMPNLEWIKQESISSFVGYPLIVENQIVGVIGLFSRQYLSQKTINSLAMIVDQMALGIKRKQQEVDLARNRERYRAIVEDQTELICRSLPNGHLSFVNGAYCRYFDRSAQELLGQGFLPFIPEPDQNRVKNYLESLFQLRPNQPITSIEHRVLIKGEIRWLQWTHRAIFNRDNQLIEFQGIGRDITERKQYEAALEKERQQLQQLITYAPVAIAMFDREMRYLAHSYQWLLDYNLPGKNLIGQSHYEVFPDLPQHWKEDHQRVLNGEILSHPEDIFQRANRTIMYLKWALHPWYKNNNEIGGIVMVTQVINELVEAREEALKASRLKSQFLATMSHEIRTPMNGVIGMTDLLLKTDLDPEQRDFVETLKTSGQNLLVLINDILDFSKLEAGEMTLETVSFNLNNCLEEVINLLTNQANLKGLDFLIDVDSNLPLNLKGDPYRLRQILLNLGGNAVKFTEQGKVTIQISLESETPQAVKLRFEVTDTGIGIAPQDQEKLFQSFVQLDASHTRQYGGTGLGLAICQQLINLMGGEIGIKSQLGKGSTFWFTVTFEKQITPLVCAFSIDSPLKELKLLVLDNTSNYSVISSYVQAWGMKCDQAQSMSEAIAKLRHSQDYDLAMIDLQQLDMTGDIFNQWLRHEPFLKQLKWIVLISIDQHQQAKKLLTQGVDGFLIKPINPSRLLETLLKTADYQRDKNLIKPQIYTHNYRILLVEDTPVNQKVILNQLKLLGYQADWVENGQEALDILEINHYDLILMDCLMPILDGYKTTQLLREREGTERHTIIVAMTANAMKEDRAKCLAVGMDDYISKPVSFEILEAVLKHWLPIQEVIDIQENLDHYVLEQPETEMIIDLERLSELTRGDREFQRELLESFLEDAPRYLETIKQALTENNYSEIANFAHRLKGAAATVGIKVMPDLAKQLEKAAFDSKIDLLPNLIADLESYFPKIEQFYKTYFKA